MMCLPATQTMMPPPVGLCAELKPTWTSVSVLDTSFWKIEGPPPGVGMVIVPTLPSTANRVPDAVVQTPPLSAVPQPALTIRPKSSEARIFGVTVAVTVTECVTVSFAPSLSVTVKATAYVPAATYVCDGVAPDPAAEPSPKFHEYADTTPLTSDE